MLSAVLTIAVAAPSGVISYSHVDSHNHSPISYESVVAVQPDIHVGHVLEHVPTAVSHQSRTDYHSKPIVQSIIAPVVYAAQVVHAAPVVHSVHSAPIYSSAHSVAYSAPLQHSSAPLVHAW